MDLKPTGEKMKKKKLAMSVILTTNLNKQG